MENLEEQPLMISEDIRSYLYETAKWAKFLSIIGFVITVFIVLLAFSPGAFLASMNSVAGESNPYAAMGASGLTVMFMIIALIYFYPSFMLFKYANAAKQAVLFGDQPKLEVAMATMKSFFKFWGILTIVVLAFYLIAFISALAFMSAA
ncbi:MULTISPECIES: DUF5362 family protein [Pedobacter]|uniref:DUF5362 family protein n=1 Tax=Pedobacter TaxID=84567 RepID=UPI00210E35C6|nr:MULTISPECIES: DUF5362 family protein [unclassified Pedobacter]